MRRNPLPQLVPQRVRRAKLRVDAQIWREPRAAAVQGGPVLERPVPLGEAKNLALTPVRPGEHFGPPGGGWHQRWFRVEAPARVGDHLHWDCLGESTVWLDGGEPWAGLDFAHPRCPWPRGVGALWIETGCYATGIRASVAPPIGPAGVLFGGARVAQRDALAWKVSGDLDVLLQLLNVLLAEERHAVSASRYGHQAALERASPLLRVLLAGLDAACDALDAQGLAACAEALEALRARLPAEPWQPIAAVAPQTHIDLVWLWPEEVAERKAVHSMATAQRLLDAYPQMPFVASQPAMYRAIERRAPALAAQIGARIAEGRWEALGGFEVEPDTQLPCGEALARSLAMGQRKLAELRGKPSSVCWLPDVFGYAGCLPQLLRLGGVTSFFTTKLRWSAVTRFPYQSFVWRGSDGSEVLAQISTIGYTGAVDVEPLVSAAREHNQLDVSPEMLLAQGYGDGGGGPTEEMCERVARLHDLAGVPRARWSTAEAFFARLAERRDRLPVYQGELYLEYHRGTYTTQSETKRLYRAAERALQAQEAARVVTGGGPIDEAPWRRLAFAQFHDALPGSSIGEVYRALAPELAGIADRALAAATAELGGWGDRIAAFNPLALPRTVVVPVPEVARAAEPLARLHLPALGEARFGAPDAELGGTLREVSGTVLDNGLVRAQLDDRGRLAALSIGGQPLLLDGPSALTLHPDHPAMFDAWDIDHAAVRLGQPVDAPMALRVHERGPLRAILRGDLTVGTRSRAQVDWILEASSPWLRLELEIDWQEDHRLLRLVLPTRYHGRLARFGAPFGATLRPQLAAGPAEEAMWEVPGSRWAAVTDEQGHGLALVTEAKYGFSCRDGAMGVSLLRSPGEPDPRADRGRHRIRLAIGRHGERIDLEGALSTAAAAEALFAPVLIAAGGERPPPPLQWRALGTLCPSWAAPLPGNGFLLRLHETAGTGGTAVVELAQRRRVSLVDLLGEPLHGVAQPRWEDETVLAIPYRPYQIVSLRVG